MTCYITAHTHCMTTVMQVLHYMNMCLFLNFSYMNKFVLLVNVTRSKYAVLLIRLYKCPVCIVKFKHFMLYFCWHQTFKFWFFDKIGSSTYNVNEILQGVLISYRMSPVKQNKGAMDIHVKCKSQNLWQGIF